MMELTKSLKDKLLKIGTNVAMGWGGACYDVEVKPRKKEVVFECVENGEFFITTLTFEEILEEYKVDVATEYKKCKKPTTKKDNKKEKEDKAQLLKIGAKVALNWGAECYDVEKDRRKKEVTFYCVEFGERFVTSLKFKDIEEMYGYKVV